MKVILLDEVKGQGGEGDVVEVAAGFANNYLLPRKLAVAATPGNLKLVNGSALVSYTLSRSGNNLMLNAQRQATLASLAPASLGAMGSALEALGQSGNSSANALFGALDARSSLSNLMFEIEALADNTLEASEAWLGYLKPEQRSGGAA